MQPMMYPLVTTLIGALMIYAARLYAAPGVGAILAEQAKGKEPPKKSFFERIIMPVVRRITPGYEAAMPFVDRRKIRQLLAWSGEPSNLTVHDVVRLKVASMVLAIPLALYFGFVLSLNMTTIIIIALASALPFFFVPDMWLTTLAERRQEAITLALPDFMDLLAISIAAGVGFDLAINNIVLRIRGPLAEEMDRMLRELRLGNPRRQTYRRVIWRNDSQALRSFFTALVQADELGTPIADILEAQAQMQRHRRIQEARRQGAKASTKISLIMSTVLLFSLVGIILATMALNLAYGRIDVLTGG